MTGLPAVIALRHHNRHCEVDLLVTAENPWFEGHFPNQPILPGVVQIGWAVHFADEIYKMNPKVNSLEQIKFKRPILPNRQLTLQLTQDIERKKLSYEYRDADYIYSSGILYYETT